MVAAFLLYALVLAVFLLAWMMRGLYRASCQLEVLERRLEQLRAEDRARDRELFARVQALNLEGESRVNSLHFGLPFSAN